MAAVEVFAPAKINLTLHVTGQRDDGYHLLDSLVVFADVGDQIRLWPSGELTFSMTGPEVEGIPDDLENLCVAAALAFGQPARIELEKNLPPASGIGGGSSDAAAVLTGLEELTGQSFCGDPATLGADVPVCRLGKSSRMRGVGDLIEPHPVPPLHAVLVNPRVEVSTPRVFKELQRKDNSAMDDPPIDPSVREFCAWLSDQRNDLEAPAIRLSPQIGVVLKTLSTLTGQLCVRMSGSGATCFALFDNPGLAELAAKDISLSHPDWWVRDCCLN